MFGFGSDSKKKPQNPFARAGETIETPWGDNITEKLEQGRTHIPGDRGDAQRDVWKEFFNK